MKYLFLILLIGMGGMFAAEMTSKDVIQYSLQGTGIKVIEVGTTEEGAVIIYDLGSTMSQGKILTASTLCLILIADEYPESEMVFAIARVGEYDVFVSYAETKDALAFRDNQMTPEEFAEKIYGKVLVSENVNGGCCGTLFILLCSLFYIKTNL